ncbi:MAG: hypothetical protein ACODAU_08460 [Myxococcota bacterium]
MRRWLAVPAFCALSACVPEYSGEPVGTYEVTGALEENACGSQAVDARDPVMFRVEVRREGDRAWWRRPDAPLVEGTVDADGVYSFRSQARRTVIEPDPDAGDPGCVVEQAETVEARLLGTDADAGTPEAGMGDAAAPPTMLEGTHVIDLSPVAGSDCTAALAVSGGPFRALPCNVDYTLAGSPTDPL